MCWAGRHTSPLAGQRTSASSATRSSTSSTCPRSSGLPVGAGSRCRQGGGYLNLVRRRARRLLVPYAVFGVLSSSLYTLAGGGAAALAAQAQDSYYAGIGGGSWGRHLLSLVHAGGWPDGVTCLYGLLDRFLPARRGQLAVAVLLLPLSWLLCRAALPSLPWGLSLVPRYLPFVVFGRWLRPEDAPLSGRGSGLFLTVAWLAYAMCAWAEPNTWLGGRHFGWFLVFTGMTFAGLVLSVWTVRRLGGRSACAFASLGVASLGVMLLQATVAAVLAVGVAATGGSWALSRLPGIRRLVASR